MKNKEKQILRIIDKYKSSISKEDFSKLISLLSDSKDLNPSYCLFTDGACEFDNDYKPINAGIGGVIKKNNIIIDSFAKNIGVKTNNESEYLALIDGIKLCIQHDIKAISIYADSELIVKQVNGDYKVKNERMSILCNEAHAQLSKLDSWKITHILRDKNSEADELSKEGLSKEKTNV
jgi:ribonuclease HI